MAFHNTNFRMIPLTGGTYSPGDLGDGITGSTVHEVYCLTPGTISINAFGGGAASFIMTAGQSVKVLVASCTIVSGTYVGFKTQWSNPGISNIQWGGNS